MARKQEVTGWVGWVYFTSFLLMIAGLFQTIAGLAALFKDDVYAVTANHLMVLDYTQWGWIHLFLGIMLLITGAALYAGKTWAIVLGVILVGLNAVSQFVFLNAYPIWSLLIIIMDFFIAYALIVHGTEVREDQG